MIHSPDFTVGFGLEWGAFLAVSALLAMLTRASLRRPASPGFFRFFAWETIFLLFLMILPHWLEEVFAIHQIASWFLLIASPCVLAPAILALRRHGRARAERPGEHLLAFERTTRLVTEGVFHYVRHPMYASLLLLTWGLFWKRPVAPTAVLAIAASVFLVLAVRLEEAENLRFFGARYREYMKRTKRFVPFLI